MPGDATAVTAAAHPGDTAPRKEDEFGLSGVLAHSPFREPLSPFPFPQDTLSQPAHPCPGVPPPQPALPRTQPPLAAPATMTRLRHMVVYPAQK